jgi:hypothetical protein
VISNLAGCFDKNGWRSLSVWPNKSHGLTTTALGGHSVAGTLAATPQDALEVIQRRVMNSYFSSASSGASRWRGVRLGSSNRRCAAGHVRNGWHASPG